MSPDHVYATTFCARIDPDRGVLSWVNAGHETALLVRSDLRAERLEPTGPVLGLSKSAVYRERQTNLSTGDLLVAVSDGVTEDASAPGRTENPEMMMLQLVREKGCTRFRDLPRRILDAVRRIAGAGSHDRTVVAIRRRQDAAHGRCLALAQNHPEEPRNQTAAAA